MSTKIRTKEELAKTDTYGLGIFATAPKLEQTFENDAVRYEYENKKGLHVSKWNGEKPLRNFKFTDEYFKQSFENIGGGLVVTSEKGSEVDFELSTIIEKSGSDMVFVVAEENSVLRIFETVNAVDSNVSDGVRDPVRQGTFFGRNIFVRVEKGASVTFSGTADIPAGSAYFSHRSSHVLENGKMEWYGLFSGSETIRSITEDSLAGNGAESYVYDMALCSGENFDIYNTSRHEADNTASHIFARGIAGGGGKIVYRALSDIREGVVGATGRQDGRFLIASSGAEIDAIPSLDIGSSESSSSHALFISHLRDSDYFYPALRGIAPYHAQAMLLSGFLSKLLEKLPAKWQTAFLEPINKKLSSPMYRFD
ncbi:MAG: SufD family Fe-S cluster assembly protein [Candidatus Parcubacteria bacterium]|nr:SufD family Fe-S cluster assembly protein [Candidatus Parcubacteria bacterium]